MRPNKAEILARHKFTGLQINILCRLTDTEFKPVKLYGTEILSAYSLEKLNLVKVVVIDGYKHAIPMNEIAKEVALRIQDCVIASRYTHK